MQHGRPGGGVLPGARKMDSTEDAKVLALVAAALELSKPQIADNVDTFLDAMPIPELASMWGVLQRLSRREQTGSAFAAKLCLGHLPRKNPDRALDLALEVLRSEIDKRTVMELSEELMPLLIYAHGDEVIERIEAEAEHNEKLRWLLGGIHFGPDEPFKDRIAAIADLEGWRVDELARRTPKHPLDCAAMSIPELACAWVEQYSKSARDRDDNFFAMMDYERDVREEDPEKAIDLIVEILKIETNPVLLSLLAAGPLEDVIGMETIDRIEREASADERFRKLLGGVWYRRASDELKARLDALVCGSENDG
jgi:hypothetical protein